MRTSLLFLLLIICSLTASAQSESFATLRNKFRGKPDVVYISTSGLFARAALMIAGERDFKRSIRHIRNFRLVTIPKNAFTEEAVTVNGFRHVLKNDSYVEMTAIRDHGDDVWFYLQEGKNKKQNKYFILIDDDNDVIGIELKGYLDPQELTKRSASARR
jgi:hypothetical protein